MGKQEILESFSWLPPGDLRVKRGAGEKVIIRGRALFAGTVSRNLRKYVKEELVRAARTLVGKPITVNHDDNKIVGHIIDAEEEENTIEYVGEVNGKTMLGRQYVQKLLDGKTLSQESYYKKWMKNPIKSPSVQAVYRHNRCVECGEQFYDEESFTRHMWDVHKQKNFQFEPRGIIMNALSLVEDPERPGVPGATLEVVEKQERGMSRLMETLTADLKNEMEYNQKMSNVVVSSTKRIAADAKKLKEQNEKPPMPQAAEKPECEAGTHWDEAQQKCVPDEEPAAPEKVEEQTQQEVPEPHVEPAKPCAEGFTYNEETGECEPEEWTATSTPETPAPLMVPEPTIDIAKVDVSTPAPAATTGPVIEFTLPKLLSLGEPFADYANFEDCVAKNQGKVDDPEAYCATIKRKVEGETVKETAGNIYELLTEVERKAFIRDWRTAEIINILNRGIAKLAKNQSELHIKNHKNTQGIQEKMKENNRITAENVEKTVKAIKESNKFISEYIEKTVATQNEHFSKSLQKLSECTKKNIGSIATYAKQVKEQVEQQKRDYEKILNAIDAKHTEVKENYKTLEQRVKEQEDELEKRKCPEGEHYNEEAGKCVPDEEPEEVKEIKDKLASLESEKQKNLKETESLTTRMDNLEAKLKGDFKGHNKPVEKKTVDYERAEKALRETAKKRK